MNSSKKPLLTLDASIVQDNVPIEIMPKIFIGSIHSAFNNEALLQLGISHILNASRFPATFPKFFTYLTIDLKDKETSNILSCIPSSNIFIEAGIDSGGILVHCFGGRSRSAAFIAAYMISSYKMSYDEAITTIKRLRPTICINKGFEMQLKAYAHAHCDIYLAQQLLLHIRIRMLRKFRGNVNGYLTAIGHKMKDINQFKQTVKTPTKSVGPHKRTWDDVKLAVEEIATDSEEHDVDEEFCDGIAAVDAEESLLTLSKKNNTLSDKQYNTLSDKQYRELVLALSANSKNGVTQTDFENDSAVSSSQTQHKSHPPSYQLLSPLLSPNKLSSPRSAYKDTPTAKTAISHQVQHTSSSTVPDSGVTKAIGGSLSSSSNIASILESKSPNCRLSIPGSQIVRIIPPLRGLERSFCCSWCHSALFSLANVIRLDLCSNSCMSSFLYDECIEIQTKIGNHSHKMSQEEEIINSDNNLQPVSFNSKTFSSLCSPAQTNATIPIMPLTTKNALKSNSKKSFTFDDMFDDAGLVSDNKSNVLQSLSANQPNIVNSCFYDGGSSRICEAFYLPPKSPVLSSSSAVTSSCNRQHSFSRLATPVDNTYNNSQLPHVCNSVPSNGSNNICSTSASIPRSNSNNNLKLPVITSNSSTPRSDSAPLLSPHTQTIPSKSFPMIISNTNSPSVSQHNTGSLDVSSVVLSSCRFGSESRNSPVPDSNTLSYVKNDGSEAYKNEYKGTLMPLKCSPSPYSENKLGCIDTYVTELNDNNDNSNHSPSSTILTRQLSSSSSRPLSGRSRKNSNASVSSVFSEDTPCTIMVPPNGTSLLSNSPRLLVHTKLGLDRPPTAEKARWLARINLLLNNSHSANDLNTDTKCNNTTKTKNITDNKTFQINKIADDDDNAMYLAMGSEKFIYVEYLPHMGHGIFDTKVDKGEINCYGCNHLIGVWTWLPNDKQSHAGLLNSPVIRIHKKVLSEAAIIYDHTPALTPRATGGANGLSGRATPTAPSS